MKLAELLPLQKKLDQVVYEKHGLHTVHLHQKRKIWLLVELSECANELRFFKYASKQQEPNDPDKVLEEYVDVVHLVLSAWLSVYPELKESKRQLEKVKPMGYAYETEDLFGSLFYEISSNLYTRIDLVMSFVLGLGKHLGYTEEKIITAYKRKHEINLYRQKVGY